MTTQTTDPLLVDDYRQSGWFYELLYLPESGEVNIRVTGSEKGEEFERIWAPPGEKAKEVFADPFGNLRYEVTR